jgi:hypothetical protein
MLVRPDGKLRRASQPSLTDRSIHRRGLGWLEVECNRCKTRASLPLDAIRRPRDMPIWKLEAALTEGPLRAAGAHGQSDGYAGDINGCIRMRRGEGCLLLTVKSIPSSQSSVHGEKTEDLRKRTS